MASELFGTNHYSTRQNGGTTTVIDPVSGTRTYTLTTESGPATSPCFMDVSVSHQTNDQAGSMKEEIGAAIYPAMRHAYTTHMLNTKPTTSVLRTYRFSPAQVREAERALRGNVQTVLEGGGLKNKDLNLWTVSVRGADPGEYN